MLHWRQCWLNTKGYLPRLKCQSKYLSVCSLPRSSPSAIGLLLRVLASVTHPKSSLCDRQERLDVIIVTAAASVFTPTAHLSRRREADGETNQSFIFYQRIFCSIHSSIPFKCIFNYFLSLFVEALNLSSCVKSYVISCSYVEILATVSHITPWNCFCTRDQILDYPVSVRSVTLVLAVIWWPEKTGKR